MQHSAQLQLAVEPGTLYAQAALFICSPFGLKNALQPSAAGPFSFRGTVPCGSQNRKIVFAGRCPAPRRSPRRLRGALPRTLPPGSYLLKNTVKVGSFWEPDPI